MAGPSNPKAPASPSASRTNLTPPPAPVEPNPEIENQDTGSDVDMTEAKEINVEAVESLKLALPDKFKGDRRELETFLLQIELYFTFNKDKFSDSTEQSLWATSYLRGEALVWIQPFLRDYFNHKDNLDQAMKTTQTIFAGFGGFKREIRRMYGDIDATQTAIRKLLNLKQTGSAMTYATEFQRYGNETGWDARALMEMFQRGLKDHLREEMARQGLRYRDMVSMIEGVTLLDNRLHEFRQNRRNNNNNGRDQNPGKRWKHHKESLATKEVNATQAKPRLSEQEKARRREKKLCYECGLPGHQARSHRKGKGPGKQISVAEVKYICATERRPLEDDSSEDDSSGDEINRMVQQVHSITHVLDDPTTNMRESLARLDEATPEAVLPRERHEEDGSSDSSESSSGPGKPRVGELWIYEGEVRKENVWRKSGHEDLFQSPLALSRGGPEEGHKYRVTYEDPTRVVFKDIDTKDFVYERNQPDEEVLDFQDLLQEGHMWEIVGAWPYYRIWKRTTLLPWQRTERCLEASPEPFDPIIKTHTPYCFKGYGLRGRLWTNMFTGERIYEATRTEAPREIAATTGRGQLQVEATLRGKPIKVMIDSGATGNFISPRALGKVNAPIKPIRPYELQVVDGTNVLYNDGIIDQGITPSRMTIDGRHQEDIQLDIAPIGKHDVILGMPWIEEHNPDIDWVKKTVSFTRCHCEGSQ
jgi:hypothetical protein